MSKFNTKVLAPKADTVNNAGGVAYSYSDFKKEVASVVLSSMLNGNSYYEMEKDRLKRIEKLVSDNTDNALFLAKAMVYTRLEGNLRSVSHFMGVLLAEKVKGEGFIRRALTKSFNRPDDMTEMLALLNSRGNKTIPNSLRRAFKDALETKFDAYQMKKYLGAGSSVKLRDVVKLSHPSPKNFEDKDIFKKVIEGTLPNIMTAQTVNAGSTGEDRAGNYSAMLKERKLGYMAALKNIKNILLAKVDTETIDALCGLLTNENAVRKSMVLPFRFVQAYKEVEALNMDRLVNKKVLGAIEQGFILSSKNVSIVQEGESVAILLDESGSMGGYTDTSPFGLGKTLMASMLCGLDKDKTLGYLWADNAREVSIDGSPMNFIKNTSNRGGGTDVWGAIQGLIKTNTKVDKLVIFTDMQMYDIGRWGYNKREFKDMVKEYRKISPNVKVLFWNLQGYGRGTPMKLDHGILEVSGFSDKMLEVAAKMWTDKDALIRDIEEVTL